MHVRQSHEMIGRRWCWAGFAERSGVDRNRTVVDAVCYLWRGKWWYDVDDDDDDVMMMTILHLVTDDHHSIISSSSSSRSLPAFMRIYELIAWTLLQSDERCSLVQLPSQHRSSLNTQVSSARFAGGAWQSLDMFADCAKPFQFTLSRDWPSTRVKATHRTTEDNGGDLAGGHDTGLTADNL